MEKVLGVLAGKNSEVSLLEEALQSFRGELDGVILVDNSDRPEIRSAIKKIEDASAGFVTVIWNAEDIGNSGSFSQGSKLAVERGATWVMTVNDDTVLQPGTVAKMIDAYHALTPEVQKTIGLISPNLESIRGLTVPDGDPIVTDYGNTAEGQLVKTAMFSVIGYWNDALFIDQIDGEFCLRAHWAGFKNLTVPRAVVRTRWGHPDMKKIFGKTILVPNYAPYRYYYMSRNLVYLYIRHFSRYVLRNAKWYYGIWGVLVPRYFIKMVLFENNRKVKIRACLRGWRDGLLGRLGPMPK